MAAHSSNGLRSSGMVIDSARVGALDRWSEGQLVLTKQSPERHFQKTQHMVLSL
jgi:hypothetical protein